MKIIYCIDCGLPFGMTNEMCEQRQWDGKAFYCPMGHKQYFCESGEKILKKRIDQLNDSVSNWQQQNKYEKKRAAAYKGHLTRLRKRDEISTSEAEYYVVPNDDK